MSDCAVPVSWYDFVDYYPLVTRSTQPAKTPGDKVKSIVRLKDPGGSLAGELDGWCTALYNENPSYTTCCIQMSHAINMAFHQKDPSKMVGLHSNRRKNTSIRIRAAANKQFNYAASCDEMKAFLNATFEEGVPIKSKDDIKDQPGIIVFMGNQFAGIHTEIWTGDNFHQGWMRGNFASLKWPNVLFWSLGDPSRIDV